MLCFEFTENVLGMVSPPHFVYGVLRAMFLMLHSINEINFIVLLPLLLKIYDNICIAIVCFPCCDVIAYLCNQVFFLNDQKVNTKI